MPTPSQLLHDSRWQRHWQLLLLAFAATSALFAFAPAGPPLAGALHDKFNHVAAFAAMALAAALARPAGWWRNASAAGGLVVYGVFIELVQSVLPKRQAEVADLLADAVGIAAGLTLAAVLRHCWRPQAT